MSIPAAHLQYRAGHVTLIGCDADLHGEGECQVDLGVYWGVVEARQPQQRLAGGQPHQRHISSATRAEVFHLGRRVLQQACETRHQRINNICCSFRHPYLLPFVRHTCTCKRLCACRCSILSCWYWCPTQFAAFSRRCHWESTCKGLPEKSWADEISSILLSKRDVMTNVFPQDTFTACEPCLHTLRAVAFIVMQSLKRPHTFPTLPSACDSESILSAGSSTCTPRHL